MSSMPPINEATAEGGAKPLGTVRTLMLVQGGLAILGLFLLIFAGIAARGRRTAAETAELQRTAQDLSGGARILGLVLFILYLATLVGLFVAAGRVRSGSAKARTWALVIEATIIATGLINVARNFTPVGAVTFVVFNLALPIVVIVLLMSSAAKAAVASKTQGDLSSRFDIRNMPEL